MSAHKTCINNKFDCDTNDLINQLIKHQPSNVSVRRKKRRGSSLDRHLSEILAKKASGWSCELIAIFCRANFGLPKINRSTVMRRIKKFYEIN